MRLKLILAVLLLSTAMPALAQVVAQGSSSSTPYYVGGGYSRFSPDWCCGRTIDGLNFYGGLTFASLPAHLSGLGIEAEWRSSFFNHSTPIINDLTETTMGGGPVYKLLRWNRYRPYGKYMLEYGKINYYAGLKPNNVTTSTVQSMGGGIEILTFKHIWFRGDYTYQIWPNLFGIQKNLDPLGVTLGVTYDFHR